MPRKHNSGELDLGDWTDWLAKGIVAIILGIIIGVFLGCFEKKVGIPWWCVIWVLFFAVIGFRKEIRHLFRFRHALNKQRDKKGDRE